MVQLFAKLISVCIDMHTYICTFYDLIVSPSEEKWLTVCREQAHLGYLLKGLFLPHSVKKHVPFFKEKLFEASPT